MQEREMDRFADMISDRLGNGESKLDKRLTAMETNIAIITEKFLHPCSKHEDIVKKIATIETKQGFLYPVLTAIISGVIVGVIITIARHFISN